MVTRVYPVVATLLVVLALLSGCAEGGSALGNSGPTVSGASLPAGATSVPGAASATAAHPSGASNLSVFVEPDAGERNVLDAIKSANSAIDLEVYLLTDNYVITALEDAANRSVRVRVLLETHPYGSSSGPSPRQILDKLSAAGVQARAADSSYHYTHEKALVIDNATVFIMTCNLTRSGLGASNYTNNREYGIIDPNQGDVRAVEAIFNADWNRQQTPTLADANLVVSPVDARAKLAAFIRSATKSLYVEDEEMYDQQTVSDFVAAAHRGVAVEIVLPMPSGSNPDQDAQVAKLLAGGVRVRYIQSPYMHAKLMIADNGEAFVGSENFSSTSLDANREVGILIADSGVLTTLEHTFAQDWSASRSA